MEARSDDELREAILLAQACAIPTTLTAIAPTLAPTEVNLILDAAVIAPDMANMPIAVTRERLRQAMSRLHQVAHDAGVSRISVRQSQST